MVIVTPTTILSGCAVSSICDNVIKAKSAPGYQYILKFPSEPPTTPLKDGARPGSPLKKSTRFNSPESDDAKEAKESDESEISNDPDRNFYCRLAVDSRRGIFYDFKWEIHRSESLKRSSPPQSGTSKKDDLRWGEGNSWDVVEKRSSRVKVKKPTTTTDEISESEADNSDEHNPSETESDDSDEMDADESEDDEKDEGEDPEDELDGEPHTPRKRRAGQAKTPRKRTKTLVKPTPHSKAVLRRRRKKQAESEMSSPRKRKATFAIRFPEQSLTFHASMAHLPPDPWLRSMHALHVGSRPDVLPCREDEYARVLRCIGELLEEGSGGCVCKYTFTVRKKLLSHSF